MRAALLTLALLASACSSESRSGAGSETPAAAPAPGTQPGTELTRTESVTLRVLGMT